ncbi:MAG: class I SAM-dependent methyltransferase [Solirubrobacteraceae bacterium]|nr:class I SAM-dependent methyltransferase [Solirubrobacteraceae bacterium]
MSTVGWVSEDLHAWHVLRPLLDAGPYLPWSSGAMRPGGLVEVCNEILLGERQRVLELGSGASTLLFARLLDQQGGTLEAIEHDARWAAWVTAQLEREDLGGVARVTRASLRPSPHAAGELPWYAADSLAEVLDDAPFDLLIVDGPPAHADGHGLARYPALGALAAHLTEDAVVVLDDVIRPGETDVLERWEAETAFRFVRHEVQGIAIGRRPTD